MRQFLHTSIQRSICGLVAAALLLVPMKASLAPLTNIVYRVSSLTAGSYADHFIAFRTPSGMSSGAISLDFSQVVSNMSEVTIADIDLSYGSTNATLAATAGAGVWGVAIDSSVSTIAFSYPVTGGTPIAAGAVVIVKVGKTARHQVAGARQIINTGTTGSRTLSLTAGVDSGTISRNFVSLAATNTQFVNTDAGDNKRIAITVGSDTASLAIPLVASDALTVASTSVQGLTPSGGIFSPTNLTVEVYSPTSVKLAWEDNSGIESGYIVERREVSPAGAVTFSEVNVVGSNQETVIDQGLTAESTYDFRVRAYNSYYYSGYTNTARITQPKQTYYNTPQPISAVVSRPAAQQSDEGRAAPVNRVQESTIPASVSSLVGEPGNALATLRWTNPIDTDLLYNQIQWSDTTFPRTPDEGVTVYKQLGNEFVDQGLAQDAPSFYTVFAVNRFGNHSTGASVAVIPFGSLVPAASMPSEQPSSVVTPVTPQTSVLPQETPAPNKTTALLPAVEVRLAGTVTKEFTGGSRGLVVSESPYSIGGSQRLSVEVPQDTINESYHLTLSPRTFSQLQIIDASIGLPKTRRAVGETFYQVAVQTREHPVTQFEKPLSLEFSYDAAMAPYVKEETLAIYFWNQLGGVWTPVRSIVDISKKTVTAQVDHLTIYALFGEPSENFAKSGNGIRAVSQVTLEPSVKKQVRVNDLFQSVEGVSKDGMTFMAQASSPLSVCLAPEKFGQQVASITAVLDGTRYLLSYDDAEKCFLGILTTPQRLGSVPLNIQAVYANDVVHEYNFHLLLIDKAPTLSLQEVQKGEQSAFWMFWALGYIILSLIVIAFILCGRLVAIMIKKST
jgi:hypothetical protein